MPYKKKKGPTRKKKEKPRKGSEVLREEKSVITEKPAWHPSEPPPPNYDLLSVTPSMHNVRTQVDVVLDHLTKDENVKNYSSEFVRLYEAVSVAHTDKRDCFRKIDRQRTILQEQEKLVSELETKVAFQHKEIKSKNEALEKLLSETSHRRAREVQTVELVGSLREEITKLRNWEDLRTGSTEEDAEDTKIKNRLTAQKAALQEELANCKLRLADTYKAIDAVGKEESTARELAAALEEKLQAVQQDLRADGAKRNAVEEQLRDEKDLNEGNKFQIKNLSDLLQSAGDTINSLKSDIIQQRTAHSLLQKERDALNHHLEDLSLNHKRLLEKVRLTQSDVGEKTRRLADVNKQLFHTIGVNKRLEGKVRMTQSSLIEERSRSEKAVEEKKALWAEQRKRDETLKECQVKMRDGEQGSKLLKVRNDTLQTKLAKSEYALTQMTGNNVFLSRIRKRLANENKTAAKEKSKLNKDIEVINIQKQKCLNDLAALALQVELKDEEVRNKLAEIAMCKKEMQVKETQLQAQVNAYETLMFHKNSLAKNLIDRDSRLVIAKSDIKLASRCIDQLNENLSSQESKIHNLSISLDRAASLRDKLSVKINRSKETKEKMAVELREMRLKEEGHINEIKGLEEERDTMKRRFNAMMSERNVIGTQLVRRNDEIQILRVANENFRKESARGQVLYSERLDDIRVLRSEIVNLRKKAQTLSNRSHAMDLRRELFNTQRELTKEMLRRNALEDECINTINIHKWRKLESSDPDRLELVRKVSLLQKRLLKQHEKQLLNKEKLHASDQLFAALRQSFESIPVQDPKPPSDTRRLLAKKESSLKALLAEARANVVERRFYNETISQTKQDADVYRNLFFSAKRVLQSNGLSLRGKIRRPSEPFAKNMHDKF